MSTWPTELPDVPNEEGYSRVPKPNVLRSGMGYGPAKIRKRVSHRLYQVQMILWLDYSQLAILDTFYDDNLALDWDWVDFGRNPTPAARYRFVGPPATTPIGPLNWNVMLSLEMETDA